MNKTWFWILLIVILVIVLYFVYRKNFKRIVTSAVCLITGAPKTGKTLLANTMAQKDFKRIHRRWYIVTKLFKKDIEEPMYYTNTAVSFGNLKKVLAGKGKPHRLDRCIVKITQEHLTRDFRFNYKSIIFISESSLLADNQDVRNQLRNAELSLFNKLIAHETRGGKIYYDTQNSLDNHYAIKRVCSNFWFIQKSLNLFLFRVLYVREMINEDLGSNNFIDDVDTTTRKVLIWRWWYKKYDRYYFSFLTDDLDVRNEKSTWYVGGLDSFNPLYRNMSLKKRKEDVVDEKEENN